MKSLIISCLMLVSSYAFTQIVTPFEFVDQDHTATEVTAITSHDEKIYYTSISFTGEYQYSKLNILDGNDIESIELEGGTHFQAEFIIGENKNLYAVLYIGIDCDYSPYQVLIYDCIEKKMIHLSDDLIKSVAVTNLNGEPVFNLLRQNQFGSYDKYFIESFIFNEQNGYN